MTDFRNRVIERRMMRIGDIKPHPGQWRDHPKAQVDALTGVLTEIGIVEPVRAWYSERNRGALTMLDGHGRQGVDPNQIWPVDITDLSDAEADYALATLDPLAAMAQADAAALDALLASVNSGDEAVQAMLAELAQDAGLYGEKEAAEPPESFGEYDESIETAYCCPKCGYRWSGKPE